MTVQMNSIFPSSIGIVNASQFLNVTRQRSKQWIELAKLNYQIDPIYPVVQTENMVWDDSLVKFNEFVLASANEFLDKQGYDISKVQLSINDLWCQEHYKMSGHEKHVHNNGAVISAFYIIECPDNSSYMLFYDPRVGKEYGFVLPEKNERELSEASNIINYGPSNGELIITNSYVPHGFTRNRSDKPFVFLHINIYATWLEPQKVDTKLNTYSNQATVI